MNVKSASSVSIKRGDLFSRLARHPNVVTAEAGDLAQLLQKVARGDDAAFKTLYHATAPKLFAIALRILHDRDRAQDILQESYARIWERAGEFNPRLASPRTWMSVIVRNKAIDDLRSQNTISRTPPGVSEPEIEVGTQFAHVSQSQEAARLRHCLQTLEPEKRALVELAYFKGLSRSELGERFGRPEGTIKTWLRKSLATLKTCLAAH